MITDLSGFAAMVLADHSLQVQLLAEPDRDRFVALVRDLADQKGLVVTTDEVEAALVAARRRHLERWV